MSVRLVHVLDGVATSGSRTSAVCSCGWSTSSRTTTARAVAAFRAQHECDPLVCGLCGRHRHVLDGLGRPADLRVLDAGAGDQLLVCRTDERTCGDLARRRQVHLDRAACDAVGIDTPRPTLRLVR